MMPFLKRSSQNCGLEESDAKQDERDEHHDEERRQQIVAPRILGSEALYREPQRTEAVLGERAVYEARQLRQRVRPIRRLPAQRAHEAAPADLLGHPALEEGLRRGPQVEVGVELAPETFDVEQRLLQHDELRLDLDVEAAGGLEQLQQYAPEGDLLERPVENRLAHRADRAFEFIDARVGGHPAG